jgi:deazaflavin-dependent oxidoreductase (nitroreductase family)
MTFKSPEIEERVRQSFRHVNRFMVLMFRLGLGRFLQPWPRVTGRILVLVHTGRKTGQRHRTGLNFATVDGDLFVLAGFGAISDWYRNVLVNPKVEVWLPDGWWAATAEDVSDHPDRLALLRKVLIASGFAAYAFGITPAISDERLRQVTEKYLLVRIRTSEPRTGPGGPNDLAWVWPVAAFALLKRLVRSPRRRG